MPSSIPVECFSILADLHLTTEQMAGVVRALTVAVGAVEHQRALGRERTARWRERHGDVTGNVTVTSQNALARVDDNILPFSLSSPELPVKTSKKIPKKVSSVTEHPNFGAFWTVYPKRAGDRDRKAAVKAFTAALRRSIDPTIIIDGAQRYAAFCDADGKTGTEYVKQARTWLNADGWTEDYDLTGATNASPEQRQRQEALNFLNSIRK